MVKSSNLRYFACAIDCEGSITMDKHKTKKTKSGYTWQTYMLVTNCSLPFLQGLREIFDTGYLRNGQGVTKSGKPIYRLYYSPNDIRKILPLIYPYLIVKKDNARLVLEALPLIYKGLLQTRTIKDLNRLEEILKEIRSSNQW